MLGCYNVTDSTRHVPLEVLHEVGLSPEQVVDRITGRTPSRRGDSLELVPYEAVWLVAN